MCFIYKYIFVPFASKFGSCKYYFGGLVMYLLSKIGSLKYVEVCLFQKKIDLENLLICLHVQNRMYSMTEMILLVERIAGISRSWMIVFFQNYVHD